jgi:hypothetical protein
MKELRVLLTIAALSLGLSAMPEAIPGPHLAYPSCD